MRYKGHIKISQVHLFTGGLVFLLSIILFSSCDKNGQVKIVDLKSSTEYYTLQLPGSVVPTNTHFTINNDRIAIASNGRRFTYKLSAPHSNAIYPIDSSDHHSIYKRPTGIKLLDGKVLVFDDHMPPRIGIEDLATKSMNVWDAMFPYNGKDHYPTIGWDIVPKLEEDTITTYTYLEKANYFEQYNESAAFKLVLDSNGSISPEEKLFGFHPSYTRDHFTRSVRPILNFVNGQMVYAYNSIDSIFVQQHDGSTKHIKVDIQGWREPELFPIERLSDYMYVEQYLAEQPQLKMLVYAPEIQKMYLVVKLPNTYEKEDGSLELFQDGPWAIIRFNEQFEQELQYRFPGKEYHNELVLPYKNGLLLARVDHSAEADQKIKFEYHEGI